MTSPENVGIDPAAWSRFDPALRREIASTKADPSREWAVLISLSRPDSPSAPSPGAQSAAEVARDRQAAFERESAVLLQRLESASTQPLQVFWINRSVKAALRLKDLEAVARLPEVTEVLLVRQHNALV